MSGLPLMVSISLNCENPEKLICSIYTCSVFSVTPQYWCEIPMTIFVLLCAPVKAYFSFQAKINTCMFVNKRMEYRKLFETWLWVAIYSISPRSKLKLKEHKPSNGFIHWRQHHFKINDNEKGILLDLFCYTIYIYIYASICPSGLHMNNKYWMLKLFYTVAWIFLFSGSQSSLKHGRHNKCWDAKTKPDISALHCSSQVLPLHLIPLWDLPFTDATTLFIYGSFWQRRVVKKKKEIYLTSSKNTHTWPWPEYGC